MLPPTFNQTQPAPTNKASASGFSLVELITVMGLAAAMTVWLVPGFSHLSTQKNASKAATDLANVLEQARAHAIARNTYVWVGFFEEDATRPGVSGAGRVVISVVASKDGTKLYSNDDPDPQCLTPTRLTQVGKLLKLEHAHLDTLDVDEIPSRAVVPPQDFQVGNSAFGQRTMPTPCDNHATFNYPLQGTRQYEFVKILQFNPMGDITKIADTPTPCIEIGIRPAHGNLPETESKYPVAVQLSGIGGQIRVYRP